MKRLLSLTLTLAVIVLAVPIFAYTSVKSSKSNASARVTVTKVNPIDHTFTATANGQELTFDAKTLTTPPAIGDVLDVTYAPPAKPGETIYAATTVRSSKANSSARTVTTSAPNSVMTGKVVSVDKVANTFTVMANANHVVFSVKKGQALPEIGKILDITYIPVPPGRPATPNGPFAVTNLNSSRSNISKTKADTN
jgi:hypothetical protein